mgnify:FL=1|jgi:hypothetical protein
MLGAGEPLCLLNLLRKKKFITCDDAYRINILSIDYIISSLISAGFKIKKYSVKGEKRYELKQ